MVVSRAMLFKVQVDPIQQTFYETELTSAMRRSMTEGLMSLGRGSVWLQ